MRRDLPTRPISHAFSSAMSASRPGPTGTNASIDSQNNIVRCPPPVLSAARDQFTPCETRATSSQIRHNPMILFEYFLYASRDIMRGIRLLDDCR